jgi:hypothetical protein
VAEFDLENEYRLLEEGHTIMLGQKNLREQQGLMKIEVPFGSAVENHRMRVTRDTLGMLEVTDTGCIKPGEACVKFDEYLRSDSVVPERKSLAVHTIVNAFVEMIKEGKFHCDPHPGNILVTRSSSDVDTIHLIDWGAICTLTAEQKVQIQLMFSSEDNTASLLLEAFEIELSEEDQQYKTQFADSLCSSFFHLKKTLAQEHAKIVCPKKLSDHAVQLFRVMTCLSSYALILQQQSIPLHPQHHFTLPLTDENAALLLTVQQQQAAMAAAMTAARGARNILLEGQQQGDQNHHLMGMYELMEGKEVNGRGVWQMAGEKELFMYYASTKQWSISNREAMEAGSGGVIKVASTALTPDQVTETWLGFDGVRAFVDAPKIRACTDILLEGQEQGDQNHHLMGVYELMAGKEVNGRGVWQMAGGVEGFMYYSLGTSSGKWHWLISGRTSMEAGKAKGWMSVASTALAPDQITETWKVSDGTALVDAPKVRVRMCSAEEKRAAAERQEQERQQAMAAARKF